MKCIYCSNINSEKANFCSNCRKQIKCLNCSELLEMDSDICVVCGIEKKSEKNNYNTIEFTEGENSRSFKATFSNEVGSSIGEALGIILLNKKVNTSNQKSLNSPDIDSEIEDVDYSEVKNDKKTQIKSDPIIDIFNDANGKITLHETRLKANSKRDFSIRLTVLFLYYKYVIGTEKVFRSELTSILKDASVEDGNWRFWLAKNNLVGLHDEFVELKAPGREFAKQIISEIFDAKFDEKWKLGTSTKSRKTKKKDDDTSN